ncbi:DNA repair and recombination protein [Colletotrichum truncatum]|uniref:DNA repair and recombination protein n=1 Tax=Colletotrichum truncatum TaxID=5467 RepID=A0ACC3YBL1_COLTU
MTYKAQKKGITRVLLLGLFVPWETFMQSTSPDPGDIWERLYTDMPGRVKAVVNNIQLLHKSAEDAKKDAKLWASRSEGDEGYEFDVPEEGLDLSEEWHPDRIDLRHTFHDVVFSLQDGPGVTNGSPGIKELLQTLDNAGFSSIDDDSRIQSTNSQPHMQTTLPKQHLKITKAAQERLHKERMLAIEGDESAERPLHTGAETGFGDNDANIDFPAQPAIVGLKPASNWIAITAANTFTQAGKIIGAERTLNRMQGIALSLICEALDERTNGADRQHLQYVGGGGGTGKSWLIDTVKEVFAAKGASSRLVITATSGTAAAGIGGNTIHSAVGLAFRDADGATVEPMLSNNLEKAKERWRRRDALIIDEASMLGLQTLYDIDQKLRMLRGFPEKPFGGISVVVFTGDFLQFPPVLQKSLLSTTERIVLDEQKRAEGDAYLLGFLERLREGKQTREDAAKKSSKRNIIANRNSISPAAALAYSVDTGRKISIYLSKHKWESRIPTAEERKAAMLLGDEGKLSAAGMFPYVEGMPVVINENKYMGLKVVNGAEFTAVGILHPPGVEEIIINDRLSIFLGPPSGIILQSEETNGLAFPHLPPNTVMLPAANIRVPEKHIKILRPDLQKANVKLALVRTGLPCTPGFALTDFKAQGRTLEKTLLGLYGRTVGKNTGELERCDAVSMYVQLSRVRRFEDIALIQPLNVKQFLEARMPEELVEGTKRLRILAEATVRAFEARERDEA